MKGESIASNLASLYQTATGNATFCDKASECKCYKPKCKDTNHPSLAKLSNQVFLHHIKYDPLKLLAEDREFDEIMVEALSRSPTTLPEDERT